MKLLFSILLLFFSSSIFAQNCSDLFISEYVEGWANNKAIEIYNPTVSTIDLSQYVVIRYSNGSITATPVNAIQLIGMVASYDVYVATLDKTDPNGTGQDVPVWDSLQNRTDGFYCPNYSVSNAFYFNGDDAIVLAKGLASDPNSWILVDIFGKIGEDPGTSWTAIAPYTGTGDELTRDHSLIRKPSVLKGVTNPVITMFNALSEYDSIPAVYDSLGIVYGNWNTLGYHDCACECITYSNMNINLCTPFQTPSGSFLSQTGIYNDTILNTQNCDSIITIDYTYSPLNSQLTVYKCSDYTLNGQTYNSTGTYTQLLVGSLGCDSVVTLDLFVKDTNLLVPNICIVGVNDNGNNKIIWEWPFDNSLDSFYIYKESNSVGIYDYIGGISYGDSGIFVDVSSNPQVQASLYKLSSLDTCGYESVLGNFHKTIHLAINQGSGQTWNLLWNHYEGIVFPSYEIYRGTNANNLAYLTTVSSSINSYSDLSPPGGVVYYQIVMSNPNGCDPSKAAAYDMSKSNLVNSETAELQEMDNLTNIYPNPTERFLIVEIPNLTMGTKFQIVDQLGREILTGNFEKKSNKIDLSKLNKGIYFIQINGLAGVSKIIRQ